MKFVVIGGSGLIGSKLIEDSSIAFSIVHATQFFEFVRAIADAGTDGGTIRMAPVSFQPIAGDDVARVVGEVALGHR
jgi:uncharacterized protein YbjT (DUF2867 family)